MPKTLTPNQDGPTDIVVPINGDDVIAETTEAPLQALLNRAVNAEEKLAKLKAQNAQEVTIYAGTVLETATVNGLAPSFGLSPSDSWSVSRVTSSIDNTKQHHRITHNLALDLLSLNRVAILISELNRTTIIDYTVLTSENYFDVVAVESETNEIITSTQFSFAMFLKA